MKNIAHYPKLEVGMTVFMVVNRNRVLTCEVTISKVGRKFAELDYGRNYRILIADWSIDGGDYMSPGRCYPSEAEYLAEIKLTQDWGKFKNAVRGIFRVEQTSITVEAIAVAAKALGIDIGE